MWITKRDQQCFISLPLELLLLRVTLQTDDRYVNIIETTENEPDKADTILRGTENAADVIIALPGKSK